MKVRIEVMVWTESSGSAAEVVTIGEDELMDVLRGKLPSVFKTPVEDQRHWELRKIIMM